MHTSQPELYYWLAAIHTRINPSRLLRGLNHFTDMKTFFTASTLELETTGLTAKEISMIQQPNWKAVERDARLCEQHHCHVITYQDPRYPVLLKEISDAPLLLFVRGQVEKIMRPQIALVGARHSSPGGRETAEVLAYSLAEAGYVVTSGLAAGIDAACHRGALAGFASTVAVMGTGFQHIYPASNRHLAEKIINAGALVTEFLPGTPPKAKNFPRRNRIISGLSLGVVVIEAALKSGSLITARLAAEQGREVFALPGSIHNPLARGCHALIRQGAKLVETAQDIVEELGALTGAMMQLPVQTKPRGDDKIDRFQRELLASIGYEPTAVDTIIMRSGLTAGEVSSMLLSLELRGYVDFVTGGYVRTSVNSP